jgi:hypothetical protein
VSYVFSTNNVAFSLVETLPLLNFMILDINDVKISDHSMKIRAKQVKLNHEKIVSQIINEFLIYNF